MLFFRGFARPQLIVTVIPDAQIDALQIWQDEFDGDVTPQAIAFSNGAGIDIDAMWIVPGGGTGASVYNPTLAQGLVTRTDGAEEEAIWLVTDQDQYGALELEDEMPQPLLQLVASVQDPVSIPRYRQAGTTLDCDTSAPLAGSSVFIHDSTSGSILAQATSDGTGAFSIPMFEPGPHLVRAVNGIKTAVSLPVAAEAA